jgi:hypothetical protein
MSDACTECLSCGATHDRQQSVFCYFLVQVVQAVRRETVVAKMATFFRSPLDKAIIRECSFFGQQSGLGLGSADDVASAIFSLPTGMQKA